MKISGIDLADIGSPSGLVTKILKVETDLPDKVPIEQLAVQLGIIGIEDLETDGFEGGLITDDAKDEGIVLVARNAHRVRRRFTVAHELGHFLMPTHKSVQSGKFLCRADDMRLWSLSDKNAYARMESEANEFASLLLIAPPRLRKQLAQLRGADLCHVVALAAHFDVSKEVAARSYAQYHDEPVATVVVKDGKVLRYYKHQKFPFITVNYGQPVPTASRYHRHPNSCTEVAETRAELWLQSQWGTPMPSLCEQVLPQQNGYALLLLWAEFPEVDEEEDRDEDRTAKQRYQDRQQSWRR